MRERPKNLRDSLRERPSRRRHRKRWDLVNVAPLQIGEKNEGIHFGLSRRVLVERADRSRSGIEHGIESVSKAGVSTAGFQQ